jgi:hypothetical protein
LQSQAKITGSNLFDSFDCLIYLIITAKRSDFCKGRGQN